MIAVTVVNQHNRRPLTNGIFENKFARATARSLLHHWPTAVAPPKCRTMQEVAADQRR